MNTHEELTREHAVRGSSDRAFGIVFSVFFALAGLASLLKHRPTRSWALVLAGVFLAFLKKISRLDWSCVTKTHLQPD
jgi:hypothetical protein